MKESNLEKRMKKYEVVSKNTLMKGTPIIIRVDGWSFHTFTKGFSKPFDDTFIKAMQETMRYLCENIQGCVLGYTQSDEITLVLVDYKNLDSQSWFDDEVQKICSIAASMATMAFNKNFELFSLTMRLKDSVESNKLGAVYKQAMNKGAMFDARCFNIPKEEVTNNIYWRQIDAIRNSIQMVGQSNFTSEELYNKSCEEIKDMLFTQKGIKWSDLPAHLQRGSCCIKKESTNEFERSRWEVDKNIPIFKEGGREYIDRLIFA